jgi:glycosyltransferase involved in cell wall biosynthesis
MTVAARSEPVRITSVHDLEPGWPWIASLYHGQPAVEWHSVSTRRSRFLARLPGPHWGRIRAALQIRRILARNRADLVVSHGPYTSYYVEALGRREKRDVPHLAFAFNFTDIPEGYRLEAMRRAFVHTDRFTVYSCMERELYAETFGVPIDRFIFSRWGVGSPLPVPGVRTISRPYVAAIGGEARDYATLCEAARRLPRVQFALVVRPHSLDGIDVPDNVETQVNLPWTEAWSLVWHAEAALVPLRSSRTPNGHVTIVGGMHLGKAQVITDSAGIRDYAEDGQTALLVPPHDPDAIARAVERLLDDGPLRERIGRSAQVFAAEHCNETVTVETFRQQLIELTGRDLQAAAWQP